jgi:RNA polymerase sigma factor (sigma-70 family)
MPTQRGSTRLAPPEQERRVIERLQRGDRTAVAVLYEWYSDPLFRSILSRLPVVEAAEDVLKETFRTALERIVDFEWTGTSIWFWLHRIAVNKVMDGHRRDKVRREAAQAAEHLPFPVPAPEPSPDRGLDVSETARDVQTSLSRMNARYASALEMRLLQDRSREECATAFGMTMGAFDVLFHRACKAFRKVYPP